LKYLDKCPEKALSFVQTFVALKGPRCLLENCVKFIESSPMLMQVASEQNFVVKTLRFLDEAFRTLNMKNDSASMIKLQTSLTRGEIISYIVIVRFSFFFSFFFLIFPFFFFF
jgi:hypothetical protein